MTARNGSEPRRTSSPRTDRIVIQDVRPAVDGGRYPAKVVAGEPCVVEACAFRDGHDVMRAVLRWRASDAATPCELEMEPVNPGLDLWRACFVPPRPGRYRFTVAGWTDPYATWLVDFGQRVRARQTPLAPDAAEGAALVAAVLARSPDAPVLRAAAGALGRADADPDRALSAAQAAEGPMKALQERADLSVHPELEIVADRPRAVFGAWYEIFVRSQGEVPGRPATFRDAERRLPDIAAMGFDVVYLAPIHPIGVTKRKGRNNALSAAPGDPGSPWAIGSEAGGHDAVEPALGTLADFDHFVAACAGLGMEVALDFALQCSPDHPWVRRHPGWFRRRPDGSIRFAENPPKKYEDIYPLDFDTPDREALWNEVKRVVLFWAARGVRIFRVDNPHTKPVGFWRWLIDEVQSVHPDLLFLAEAFTRSAMMKTLGKIGFSQSYTYFTWRETKAELEEYLVELSSRACRDCFRPNFFPSTPDILPPVLVHGGRPAFKLRLILAATLSPSYGIYGGYELCENAAIPHHASPGQYEYADSEKYEIRVRNWNAPGHLKDLVARLNRIRRGNPAFRSLEGLRFLPTTNERLLAFLRVSPDGANRLLVVVNLDPFAPQEGRVLIPPEASGMPAGSRYEVRDLLGEAVWTWADDNYVRLDPAAESAHVLRIERRIP